MSTKKCKNGKKNESMLIGQRLKQLRKSLNKTQKDFCDECNISQSNIARFESGTLTPSFDYLSYLHIYHNLNIHWLISGHGDMLSTANHVPQIFDIFPNIPDEADVIELIASLEIPVMRHELIIQFIKKRIEHEDIINAYYKGKKKENKKNK